MIKRQAEAGLNLLNLGSRLTLTPLIILDYSPRIILSKNSSNLSALFVAVVPWAI